MTGFAQMVAEALIVLHWVQEPGVTGKLLALE